MGKGKTFSNNGNYSNNNNRKGNNRGYNNYDDGDDKKVYYQNNRRPQQDRPRNSIMSVNLFELGKTAKMDYDRDSLLELLSKIPFDLVSIPVYSYKDLILGSEKRGTMIVGHVNNFDAKNELFNITVYAINAETISNFSNVILFPRVIVDPDSGNAQMLLGLDICPASKYAYLYDDGEDEE